MEFLKKFIEDKKNVKKCWITAGVTLAVLLLITIFAVVLITNFKFRVTAEAGEAFDTDIVWKGNLKMPATVAGEVNTDEIGTYKCLIKVLGFIPMNVTIDVSDSSAPMLITKDVSVNYGEACKPEDFVLDSKDASDVTYDFVTTPDYTKIGTQTITIKATDAYHNSITQDAKLTVKGIISTYVMELGSEVPDSSVFAANESIEVSYVTQPDAESLKTIGEYPLQLLVNGATEQVVISVVDTIAPAIEVTNKQEFTNKTLAPEKFITAMSDSSEVTTAFKVEPDWSKEGEQTLVIVATDAAGNVTEKEVQLTLVKDTIAPSIGTTYIKVTVNGTLSYKKNISVSDNCDSASEIVLEIDNSAVNLSAIGSYVVHCTAKDTAGNTSSKEITVQVVDTATEVHTLEEINAYADAILAQITTESMSMYDKAYAIYKWTRSNISYLNNSQKGDWMQGAYDGMVKRAGDCFTYAATAKALLERVGLAPIVITKEVTVFTSPNNHYWLLLDLGEGYYHYDPTRRADGTWFFMWTDAQIMEYSNNHWGSHSFTRSNYPPIQ